MNDVKTIKSIDQLYVFAKTGKVVGNQNWAETSISSSTTTSGGGGHVHMGTGYIAPISSSTTTSSTSTEQLRLFVQDDDGGEEFEARFSNPGFGVREGHRVTIVYAGNLSSQAGYPMTLVNHSTGNERVFKNQADLIVNRLGAGIGCALLAGVPIGGMILGGTNSSALAAALALITGTWLFWKHIEKNRLTRDVIAAITQQARAATEIERRGSDKI
jgi:hypothetical protein